MTRSMLYLTLGVLLIATATAPAIAGTLLADHFGVNPSVIYTDWEYAPGQHYQANRFDPNSWVPTNNTGTADYMVDDWFGRWEPNGSLGNDTYPYAPYADSVSPSGDEPYDTEAYYFDDDKDNLYFVAVVGFPSPANGIFTEARYSDYPVVQGDFAIDIVGHGNGQTDNWGFQYSYGVDLTDEIRPPLSGDDATELRSETVGTGFYETSDEWYLGCPNGAVNPLPGDESGSFSNFDPTAAGLTATGNATVNWYTLTDSLNQPVIENQWNTYVIEVTVPRTLFGEMDAYQEVRFHWLAGCRNDGNEAQAYMTGGGVTPEPTTTALLLLGIVPLGSWLRKRRQTSS